MGWLIIYWAMLIMATKSQQWGYIKGGKEDGNQSRRKDDSKHGGEERRMMEEMRNKRKKMEREDTHTKYLFT